MSRTPFLVAAVIIAVALGLPFALLYLPHGFILLVPLVVWALPRNIADDVDGGWPGGVGPIPSTRRALRQLELLANSTGKSTP